MVPSIRLSFYPGSCLSSSHYLYQYLPNRFYRYVPKIPQFAFGSRSFIDSETMLFKYLVISISDRQCANNVPICPSCRSLHVCHALPHCCLLIECANRVPKGYTVVKWHWNSVSHESIFHCKTHSPYIYPSYITIVYRSPFSVTATIGIHGGSSEKQPSLRSLPRR